MNENWKYGILDDAVIKDSSNLSRNKIKEDDGDYPVFGAQGFIQNVSFYQQENEYLAIIKDGAGVGRVTKHPEKSSVLATMQYIIPKDGFDIDFLYYFLSCVDFDRYRTGSTIPHIYYKDYKSEVFPLIDLPEQKRIVTKLDQCFEAVDRAKANVECNLQNSKELFQSQLENIFNKNDDGWITTKLNEIILVKHGFAFKSEFFSNNGEFILLTPGNFYEDGGYRNRGEKQKYFIGEIPDGYILNKGDLLIAMTEQAPGLLGSPLIVPESGRYLHNQRLGLVQLKEGIHFKNDFLFYLFKTKKFRDDIYLSGSGVKVRHTSPTKISEISVRVHFDFNKQDSIVSTLKRLKKETHFLESHYQQELDALDELRKSILQKAFSGELTTIQKEATA